MRQQDLLTERFLSSHGMKLALSFDCDEQLVGRLNSLDFDEHHCQWDPDHEFRDGTTGGWTCDTDTETLAALRERGIPVPDSRDDIPINIEVQRLSGVDRECRKCGSKAMHSTREIKRVYPRRSMAMEIAVHESTDATHLCNACESMFRFTGSHDHDATGNGARDPTDELTLAGVM